MLKVKSLKSKVRLAALCLCAFFPLSLLSAQRELNESWKVEVGQKQKQAIKFFQAESVKLTETFTQNGRAVDLRGTNMIVVWEINGWSDYTNTYAIATGTVSSASNVVIFALSPEQSNLSASNYLGFIRALQSDGTNLSEIAVLAYQTIAVEWSPDSRNYNLIGPFTYTIMGPQGIQGETGPQGPAGSNGIGGLSAYQLAVENGFVGSEADWLASIVGPQGPPGADGAIGPQGPAGTNDVERIVALETKPPAAGQNGSLQYNSGGHLAGFTNLFIDIASGKMAVRAGQNIFRAYNGITNVADAADSNLIYRLSNQNGTGQIELAENGNVGLLLSGNGFARIRSLELGGVVRTNWYDYAALDAYIVTASNLFTGLTTEVSNLTEYVHSIPAGPAGTNGLDGLSAYQIAVENGFVGSEAEWLASIVGPQGPPGIQGETGPQGIQGTQGIQGEPGSQGIQGEIGPQGPAGTNGVNGISAYQVAVTNGFIGTESEWLDSLVGPQGPQGIQGETGSTGSQGIQGIQGIQGEPGPQGIQGEQGIQGPQGAVGISAYAVAVTNGFSGTESDWLASLVGPQGEQGIQGVQGETGPQGVQGETGPQGPAGVSESTNSVKVNSAGYLQLVSAASVSSVSYDSAFYGFRHNSSGQAHIMNAPYGATNVTVGVLFGLHDPASATNVGARIMLQYRTVNSETGRTRISDIYNNYGVAATNGWNGTGTNDIFYISAAIPSNHWNEAGSQLRVYTATPSSNGLSVYTTNYMWFVSHQFDVPVPTAAIAETDPVALPAISNLMSGTDAFDGILLDRKINSWEEIGVTYSNAVRINNPITITNDSAWIGWTTTGSLTASNEILLLTGQYLLSPVQSNGVARFEVNSYSSQNGTPETISLLSGTNEVAYPYYAQDAQLKIVAGEPLPGATAGLYISAVTLVGYENLTGAEAAKYVAGLRRTDAETHADDMTSKRYVDSVQIAAEKHADSGLSAYANDPSKTMIGNRIELGNYTIIGSGSWQGVNFIQSADSATIGTRFDDNIITLDSGLTAVEIQGITQIGTNVTLSIYAQNIDGLPTIGVTTNLMVAFASIAATVTNLGNGNYSAVVDVSGLGSAKGFFRAYATALPVSPGAVTIHADILNLAGHRIEGVSEIIFTNGWKIACTTNGLEFVQP
jgi:hypothetical protein